MATEGMAEDYGDFLTNEEARKYENIDPGNIEARTAFLNDLMSKADRWDKIDLQQVEARAKTSGAKLDQKTLINLYNQKNAAPNIRAFVEVKAGELEAAQPGAVVASTPEAPAIKQKDLPAIKSKFKSEFDYDVPEVRKYFEAQDPYKIVPLLDFGKNAKKKIDEIELIPDPDFPRIHCKPECLKSGTTPHTYNPWARMMAQRTASTKDKFPLNILKQILAPVEQDLSQRSGPPQSGDLRLGRTRGKKELRSKPQPTGRSGETVKPAKSGIATAQDKFKNYFMSGADIKFKNYGGVIQTQTGTRSLREILEHTNKMNEEMFRESYWNQYNPKKQLILTAKKIHNEDPNLSITEMWMKAWDQLNRNINGLLIGIGQRTNQYASKYENLAEKEAKGTVGPKASAKKLKAAIDPEIEEYEELSVNLRDIIDEYKHASAQTREVGAESDPEEEARARTLMSPAQRETYDNLRHERDELRRQRIELIKTAKQQPATEPALPSNIDPKTGKPKIDLKTGKPIPAPEPLAGMGPLWHQQEPIIKLKQRIDTLNQQIAQMTNPSGQPGKITKRSEVQEIYNKIKADPLKYVDTYNKILNDRYTKERHLVDAYNLHHFGAAGPKGEAVYKARLANWQAENPEEAKSGVLPVDMPHFKQDVPEPPIIREPPEEYTTTERPQIPIRPGPEASQEEMDQWRKDLEEYKAHPHAHGSNIKQWRDEATQAILAAAPTIAKDLAGESESLDALRKRLDTFLAPLGLNTKNISGTIPNNMLDKLYKEAMSKMKEKLEAKAGPTQVEIKLENLAESVRTGEISPKQGLELCLKSPDGSPTTLRRVLDVYEGQFGYFEERIAKEQAAQQGSGVPDFDIKALAYDIVHNPRKAEYLREWDKFIQYSNKNKTRKVVDISTLAGARTLASAMVEEAKTALLNDQNVRAEIKEETQKIIDIEKGIGPHGVPTSEIEAEVAAQTRKRTGEAPSGYYDPYDEDDLDDLVYNIIRGRKLQISPGLEAQVKAEIINNPDAFKNIKRAGKSQYEKYADILSKFNKIDINTQAGAQKLAKFIVATKGRKLNDKNIDEYAEFLRSNPTDPERAAALRQSINENLRFYASVHPPVDLRTEKGAKLVAEYIVLKRRFKDKGVIVLDPKYVDQVAERIFKATSRDIANGKVLGATRPENRPEYADKLDEYEFFEDNTDLKRAADGITVGGLMSHDDWSLPEAAIELAKWMTTQKHESAIERLKTAQAKKTRPAEMANEVEKGQRVVLQGEKTAKEIKAHLEAAKAAGDHRTVENLRNELDENEEFVRNKVANHIMAASTWLYNTILALTGYRTYKSFADWERARGAGKGWGGPGATFGPRAPDEEEIDVRKLGKKDFLDKFKDNPRSKGQFGEDMIHQDSLQISEAINHKIKIHALSGNEAYLNGLTGTINNYGDDKFVVALDPNIVVEDKSIVLKKGEFLIEAIGGGYNITDDTPLYDSANVDFEDEDEEPEDESLVSTDNDDPTIDDLPKPMGSRSSEEYPSPSGDDTGPIPGDVDMTTDIGDIESMSGHDGNNEDLSEIIKGMHNQSMDGANSCNQCQSEPCECCQKCNSTPCCCCGQCGEPSSNCKCEDQLRELIDVFASSLDHF